MQLTVCIIIAKVQLSPQFQLQALEVCCRQTCRYRNNVLLCLPIQAKSIAGSRVLLPVFYVQLIQVQMCHLFHPKFPTVTVEAWLNSQEFGETRPSLRFSHQLQTMEQEGDIHCAYSLTVKVVFFLALMGASRQPAYHFPVGHKPASRQLAASLGTPSQWLPSRGNTSTSYTPPR
jgi:hypothetical protein